MKRRLGKIVEYFDSNPYSIQLSYKSKFHFKSKTGGCISIIFYLIAATIIGLNLYYLISDDQLIYTSSQIKNDLSPISLKAEYFALSLKANDSNNKEFSINKTNQNQYGIYVFVSVVERVDGKFVYTLNETAQTRNIEPFYGFYIFPSIFNMTMEGRSDIQLPNEKNLYRRLGITVKVTNKTLFQQKNISLFAQFYFINNVTRPQKKDPLSQNKTRLFEIRDGRHLNVDELQTQIFYFQKLLITTDNTKFINLGQKSYTNISSYFYNEESQKEVISNNDEQQDWILHIKLKRSIFTIEYSRYYKKFTTYASESLGMIGFASLLLIFYKGYNRWAFVEKELVSQKNRTGTNLFKFYWQKLKTMKSNFRSQSKIASQQFEDSLDFQKIQRLLGMIENLKTRVEQLQRQQQKKTPFFPHVSSSTEKKHPFENRGRVSQVEQPLLPQKQPL